MLPRVGAQPDLGFPNVAVRRRAALAAGRIGDERAVAELASLLTGAGNAEAREMAAFALGEIESAWNAIPPEQRHVPAMAAAR